MIPKIITRLFGGGKPPAMNAPPDGGSPGGGGDTRHQHYYFAHLLLPRLAHAQPATLLSHLSGDTRDSFLLALWRDAQLEAPDEVAIPPTGLASEVRTHGRRRIGLVTFPQPARVPEAYFAAVIFAPVAIKEYENDGEEEETEDGEVRYLTLEYGFTLPSDPPRTILGAWTTDGAHQNFGEGPPPDLEAFYARICDV